MNKPTCKDCVFFDAKKSDCRKHGTRVAKSWNPPLCRDLEHYEHGRTRWSAVTATLETTAAAMVYMVWDGVTKERHFETTANREHYATAADAMKATKEWLTEWEEVEE